MIDWYSLLNATNTPWRDHGRNTSKGNVNICCPFCGDDNGFHLSISTSNKGYFCYRSPDHKGKSAPRLLARLGLKSPEISDLLTLYSDGEILDTPPTVQKGDDGRYEQRWQAMQRITPDTATGRQHIAYLAEQRGFPDAGKICFTYDLRFAGEGKWAQRILFPLQQRQQSMNVRAWTGRAVKDTLSPKYLTSQSFNSTMIYAPRNADTDTKVIVEGPLDALKICAASTNATGIALFGKYVNPGRLLELKTQVATCGRIVFAPDKDVPTHSRYSMLAELQQIAPRKQVTMLDIPDEFKDAGAMPYHEIRHWLGVR